MLFITDVKMFWRTETDEKALTEVEREVEREREGGGREGE